MKTLSLAIVTLTLLFGSLSFAEEEMMSNVTATAKIAKAPAFETKPAMLAATAFVRAADFAPEGGWGEKDYEGAINAMVMAGSTRLMEYMKEKGIEAAGPMFSVWYEDPTSTKAGDLTSKWGLPLAADNEPTALVTIENMPETQALTCTYEGHPQTSMNAWGAIMKYAEENSYTWTGNPMEVYHTVGEQKPDAEGWKVEIVWPCMKKEMMEQHEGEEKGE
jgi:effector-binding domain-containing protein